MSSGSEASPLPDDRELTMTSRGWCGRGRGAVLEGRGEAVRDLVAVRKTMVNRRRRAAASEGVAFRTRGVVVRPVSLVERPFADAV